MSLSLRALIAVLLMVGFYALALGISGGLLWLAWLDVTEAGGHVRLIIFAIGIAGMILWSILPRPSRYVAPGPRIHPQEQPELFAVLGDVARAAGQKMPADVYLTCDVNAGVLQTGGFLGIGSRRVMELGLPLMQSLTTSQFRAVIAHEFGHFHGGDTKLGPLIYRTREAIGRTIRTLHDDEGVTHKPFEWYGNFFLRVTQAISRAQELAADRLAAGIAGAKNAANALVAVERAGAAHHSYWNGEVMPLLVSGWRPPLVAGFDHFVSVDEVRAAVTNAVDTTLREAEKNPFDSHPPLPERLAALAELPSSDAIADEPRAVSLLRDLPRLEETIIQCMFEEWFGSTIKPITWDEAGTQVYLPAWRGHVEKHAAVLRDVTPSAFPALAHKLPDFSARLKLTEEDGEQTQAAAVVMGSALAVRLYDLGWALDCAPGKPIAFTRDGTTIHPFNIVPKLRAGELSGEAWQDECRVAEIGELPLA